MITSTKSSVRIVDLYYDETANCELKADVVRYNQSPDRKAGGFCTPFHTIVLDLTQSPEALLAGVKSHTRYKIRRAGDKDELDYSYSANPDEEAIRTFADHFDSCGAFKDLPKASRERMRTLADNGALDLSFIRDRSGELLAASSYVVTRGRARGLYAGASYRSTNDPSRRTFIGRANRYLYWRDILRLKESGIRIFDFGGYYAGNEDEEKLRVNGFKEEFGGRVLLEFNCELALTLKGKVALWAVHRRERRLWESRAAKASQTARTEKSDETSIPASV
jgi:lipid II:glycine glycyltransferase (peptidoglycan interpeptide bridge formation enzyme)